MKKQYLIVVLVFISTLASFAQKSAIRLQVGYAIPLANSQLGQNSTQGSSGTNYSNVTGSYGSGLQIEAGYVYALTEMISLQMDATYLLGNETKSNFYSNSIYYGNASSYARFAQISPQVRVTLGGSKLRPYGSVGPVIGFGTLHMKSSYYDDGDSENTETVYKGSAAIGAKTTLGVELAQGKFIFFAQVSMINMNYSPSKSELTKDVYNGTDDLPNKTVSEKQTVYKNSYSDGSQDPNQPATALKQFYPFSSLSLNAGVMFKF